MGEKLRKLTAVLEVRNEKWKEGTDQAKTSIQNLQLQTSMSNDEIEKSFNKQSGTVVKVLKDQVNNVKTNTAENRKLATEINRTERTYQKLTRELEHQNKLMKAAPEDIAVLNAQYRLGEKATEGQRKEIERLIRAQQLLEKQNAKSAGSFRMVRNGASQLQYQFQDIAVQLQAGTNPFVILGQQGSQIASLFGAKGAMVGSIIAVGAMVASVYAGDVVQAIDDAFESVEEFEKKTKESTQAVSDFIKSADITTKANAVNYALRELSETYEKLVAEEKEAAKSSDMFLELISKIEPNTNSGVVAMMLLTSAYKWFADDAEQAAEKQKVLSEQMWLAAEVAPEITGSYEKYVLSIGKQIDALEREAEAFNKSGFELFLYQKGMENAEPRHKAQLKLVWDKVQAQKAEEQAVKDMIKEMADQEKAYAKELAAKEKLIGRGNNYALTLQNQLNKKQGLKVADQEWMVELKATDSALYDRIKKLQELNREYDESQRKTRALQQLEKQSAEINTQIRNDSLDSLIQVAEEGSIVAKMAFLGKQGLAANSVIVDFEAAKAKANAELGTSAAPYVMALEKQRAVSLATIAGATVAGVFHGGGAVPSTKNGNVDQTYLLQGGEYVESRAERREIDKLVEANKAGGSNINLTYNINALDSKDIDRVLMKNNQAVYAAVAKAQRRYGKRI